MLTLGLVRTFGRITFFSNKISGNFSRVYYNQHMVGKYLCNFLDSGKLCSTCREWCFGCIHVIGQESPNNLARDVTSSGEAYVPLEMYFCSIACASYFGE